MQCYGSESYRYVIQIRIQIFSLTKPEPNLNIRINFFNDMTLFNKLLIPHLIQPKKRIMQRPLQFRPRPSYAHARKHIELRHKLYSVHVGTSPSTTAHLAWMELHVLYHQPIKSLPGKTHKKLKSVEQRNHNGGRRSNATHSNTIPRDEGSLLGDISRSTCSDCFALCIVRPDLGS